MASGIVRMNVALRTTVITLCFMQFGKCSLIRLFFQRTMRNGSEDRERTKHNGKTQITRPFSDDGDADISFIPFGSGIVIIIWIIYSQEGERTLAVGEPVAARAVGGGE